MLRSALTSSPFCSLLHALKLTSSPCAEETTSRICSGRPHNNPPKHHSENYNVIFAAWVSTLADALSGSSITARELNSKRINVSGCQPAAGLRSWSIEIILRQHRHAFCINTHWQMIYSVWANLPGLIRSSERGWVHSLTLLSINEAINHTPVYRSHVMHKDGGTTFILIMK